LQFNDLHKFFEAQYEELDDIVDEVAERARARAFGTLEEFREHTVSRRPGTVPAAKEMIAELLGDHETITRALRQDIAKADERGDVGTNDFLTGLLEKHEKASWMLRSFLG
jgi:starvation-inducible DNA-binding protein